MHYELRKIYAVEVSGACNLEKVCTWCPMHNRPRFRKRGLMTDEIVEKSLEWVSRLPKVDALALHLFGEPLLHPKFDEIALRFSKVCNITMSTNGVLMTESWADRLAEVPWAWITISPWDKGAQVKAAHLLARRNIEFRFPPGVTHNFAGQAKGPSEKLFQGCSFLHQGTAVIRWDGTLASCCISDREEDSIGTVFDKLENITLRDYSICKSCHHAM